MDKKNIRRSELSNYVGKQIRIKVHTEAIPIGLEYVWDEIYKSVTLNHIFENEDKIEVIHKSQKYILTYNMIDEILE